MSLLIFASGVFVGLLCGVVLAVILVPSYEAPVRLQKALNELVPKKPHIIEAKDLETLEEKRQKLMDEFEARELV